MNAAVSLDILKLYKTFFFSIMFLPTPKRCCTKLQKNGKHKIGGFSILPRNPQHYTNMSLGHIWKQLWIPWLAESSVLFLGTSSGVESTLMESANFFYVMEKKKSRHCPWKKVTRPTLYHAK